MSIGHLPIAEVADRADPTRRRHPVIRLFADAFAFLRFLVFVVYGLVAIVAFWLWVLATALGLLRLGLRALMASLLHLSGGTRVHAAPTISAAIQRDLQNLWDRRLLLYAEMARPMARHVIAVETAGRTFRHWSYGRKALAVLLTAAFIGAPALYVVPRRHYVQVTDDNAMHYESDGAKVRYLVHAVDLSDPGITREYMNEDAWWLGKVNSQGLKSQLQPGRFYELRVVGIRWYKPAIFPNIISALELDEAGNPVEKPRLIALPTRPALEAAP